jgi:hypothetical protein
MMYRVHDYHRRLGFLSFISGTLFRSLGRRGSRIAPFFIHILKYPEIEFRYKSADGFETASSPSQHRKSTKRYQQS